MGSGTGTGGKLGDRSGPRFRRGDCGRWSLPGLVARDFRENVDDVFSESVMKMRCLTVVPIRSGKGMENEVKYGTEGVGCTSSMMLFLSQGLLVAEWGGCFVTSILELQC